MQGPTCQRRAAHLRADPTIPRHRPRVAVQGTRRDGRRGPCPVIRRLVSRVARPTGGPHVSAPHTRGQYLSSPPFPPPIPPSAPPPPLPPPPAMATLSLPLPHLTQAIPARARPRPRPLRGIPARLLSCRAAMAVAPDKEEAAAVALDKAVKVAVAAPDRAAVAAVGVGEELPEGYDQMMPAVEEARRRRAGVLLHPTSLRGPHGIGDLGDEAVAFLAWLRDAGCTLWQVSGASHYRAHG